MSTEKYVSLDKWAEFIGADREQLYAFVKKMGVPVYDIATGKFDEPIPDKVTKNPRIDSFFRFMFFAMGYYFRARKVVDDGDSNARADRQASSIF